MTTIEAGQKGHLHAVLAAPGRSPEIPESAGIRMAHRGLDLHRDHARLVPLDRRIIGEGWQDLEARRRVPRPAATGQRGPKGAVGSAAKGPPEPPGRFGERGAQVRLRLLGPALERA